MKTIQQLRSNCFYKTDEYEIKRWSFGTSMEPIHGFNDCFCFVLVTTGQYSFRISNNQYKTYTGHVIAEKPNFEYSLCPSSGTCTIINFSRLFYERLNQEPLLKNNHFLKSGDVISQLILSNPIIDYLHYKLLQKNDRTFRLEIDDTVFEIAYEILNTITDTSLLENKTEHHHHQLSIVERAKEYIHAHFQEDIGLNEIAFNSFTSPFHFSRLFRKFTLQTPHQYLLSIRLKHSEILLKTSARPVAEIALSSGFSGPDYFSTAFKKKYNVMPTDYRKNALSRKSSAY